MTPSARALLFGLALLPLACPLLLDDDFVFEDEAMSGTVPHACRDKD
jgi:hypothetical protein